MKDLLNNKKFMYYARIAGAVIAGLLLEMIFGDMALGCFCGVGFMLMAEKIVEDYESFKIAIRDNKKLQTVLIIFAIGLVLDLIIGGEKNISMILMLVGVGMIAAFLFKEE